MTSRRIRWGIGSGLLGLLLAIGLERSGALLPLENAAYDWRVRTRPPTVVPTPPIVLLLIDQKSLDYFRRESGRGWPWRRDLHAALIAALDAHGARAIGFDLLFTEPSEAWPEDDAALVEATTLSGHVVHALDARLEATADRRGDDRDDAITRRRGLEVADQSSIAWPAVNQLAPPIESLAAAAAGLGSVRFAAADDGVARAVEVMVQRGGRLLPAFSVAVAALVGTAPVRVDDQRRLHLGGRAVPLDPAGRMYVRYLGPPGTFRSISAHVLIHDYLRELGGEPAQFAWPELRGAIVLVGTNFTDLKQSPLGAAMAGVEIHANALAGLLAGVAVRAAPGWASLLVGAALALFAGGFLVITGRPLSGASVPLAAIVTYVWGAREAFGDRGLWLPIATPVAAALCALVAASLASYRLEGRERRFLKRAFAHYLDPHVIETLVADPSRLRLGGISRELTLYFSDLAGFTSISERLTPEALVELLNRYLTDMTHIILERRGTLDKYIGDAIMAFWGAPVEVEDGAARACHAAIDSVARLRVLATELDVPEAANLRARIGLASGPAVVGNMGSAKTFNYTAMGDTVNLAARLEGLNKEYGTTIMASDATRLAAGPEFLWRELDLVRVKGKEQAVRIHELVGRDADAASWQRERVAIHATGLARFRVGAFAEAAAIWAAARERWPDDGPFRVMHGRCADYLAEPPPDDWQGEHVMLTK